MHTAHDFQPAFSPDGKFLAFSSNRHGNYDCFIIPAQGGKSKRLTFDSANDLVSAWSPDSSKAAFLSDRSGRIEVFLLESADAEHPKFIEAHQFKVKQITNDEKPESSLTFSPDGKKIYFRGWMLLG